MDDNTLHVMFEEIKTSLDEIKKKTNTPILTGVESNNQLEIEKIYCVLAQKIDGITHNVGSSLYQILEKYYNPEIDKVNKSIESIENVMTADSFKLKHLHRYEYSIDVKSSKTIICIATLSIALLLSIMFNVTLFSDQQQYENNDWKYRYIKSIKGINKNQLGELERIFEYDKDQEMINKIKESTKSYESALSIKANNIEQHELMGE